jgi:hypothetical protein
VFEKKTLADPLQSEGLHSRDWRCAVESNSSQYQPISNSPVALMSFDEWRHKHFCFSLLTEATEVKLKAHRLVYSQQENIANPGISGMFVLLTLLICALILDESYEAAAAVEILVENERQVFSRRWQITWR